MWSEISALAGMFLAAFLAATPIPMQSELAFVALAANGWSLTALVVAASIGNILGSCLTYAAGRGLGGLGLWRWFHLPAEKMARAESWFARWGRWSLLLSWAPGGDLLVALAGALRMPLVPFLILISLAKTGRYIALALATQAAF
ncbi:YqaA family protein [Tabrizicola sp.]|uniref:YqaA family protein n=1 Tax=Tabrizicola sp. TaxID=2005166 RepID=UPI003D2A4777